jgi:hypothetical protein
MPTRGTPEKVVHVSVDVQSDLTSSESNSSRNSNALLSSFMLMEGSNNNNK